MKRSRLHHPCLLKNGWSDRALIIDEWTPERDKRVVKWLGKHCAQEMSNMVATLRKIEPMTMEKQNGIKQVLGASCMQPQVFTSRF